MEKRNYIREAYDNYLKEAILVVSDGGASMLGSSSHSMIITKDRELYDFRDSLMRVKGDMKKTSKLSKEGEFSEEQMKEIIDFIDENVLPKNGTFIRMFDAFYNISGRIDGKNFHVSNDMDLTSKLKKLITDMIIENNKEKYC